MHESKFKTSSKCNALTAALKKYELLYDVTIGASADELHL